jgi:hypothetical protein
MKRGLTPGILVGVIAVVAALTVTLIMVVPKLTDVLFTSGEQSQCQFNLLLSKTAETATFGFGKEMPVDCKTTRKTITQNDLARYTALASQAIEKYPPNSAAAKEFPLTQEGKDKWALANIIANDMKSCYDRGWRGQLDLGSVPGVKGAVGGALGTLGEDYLCILCTRYTFDQYTSTIPSFPIKPWLEQNVVQDRTFYDYLKKDDNDQFAKTSIARSYITPKEPLTVMFVADTNGQGAVLITPYSKLTSKLGESVIATNVLATQEQMNNLYGYAEYIGAYTRTDAETIIGSLAFGPIGAPLVLFTVGTNYLWRVPVKCHTIIGD